MKRLSNDQGFTLLEMVIATAILAMAFAALFPILGSAPGKLRDAKEAAELFDLTNRHFTEQLALEAWDCPDIIVEAETVCLSVGAEEGEWAWEVSAGPYENVDITELSAFPMHVSARGWRVSRPEAILVELDRVVWVQNQ